MMDQLKQELAKEVYDKTNAEPVVEMNEQKTEELVGREVCQQSSGFMTFMTCSMNFDKWYPKSRSHSSLRLT